MYRSRRSSSTPRMRLVPPKRSSSKVRELESRPQWDDTTNDVTKYKATPEELERRKNQRVSKHMINLQKLKRISVHGVTGHDQGHEEFLSNNAPAEGDAHASLSHAATPQQAASPQNASPYSYTHERGTVSANTSPYPELRLPSSAGRHSQQRGTPEGLETSTSPAIDFKAVLKLLHKSSPGQGGPTPSEAAANGTTTNTPSELPNTSTWMHGSGAASHIKNSAQALPADHSGSNLGSTSSFYQDLFMTKYSKLGDSQATSRATGSNTSIPDVNAFNPASTLPSSTAPKTGDEGQQEDEVFDATLGSFSCLEMGSVFPAHDAAQAGVRQTKQSDLSPRHVDKPGAIGVVGHPAVKVSSAVPKTLAQSTSVNTMGLNGDMSLKLSTMEAHLGVLETKVDRLTVQQSSNEQDLQRIQTTQRSEITQSHAMQQQVMDLKSLLGEVQSEQKELRKMYDLLSQTMSSQIAQLQTQMLQLLRTAAPVGETGRVSHASTTGASLNQTFEFRQSSFAPARPTSTTGNALPSIPHWAHESTSIEQQQQYAPWGEAQQLKAANAWLEATLNPSQQGDHGGRVNQNVVDVLAQRMEHLSAATATTAHDSVARSTTAGVGDSIDDALALPSYAAMRRSFASVATTSRPTTATMNNPVVTAHMGDRVDEASGQHRYGVFKDLHQSVSNTPGVAAHSAYASTSHDMDFTARGADTAEHTSARQADVARRTMPSQYQARAVGGAPIGNPSTALGIPGDLATLGVAGVHAVSAGNKPTASWLAGANLEHTSLLTRPSPSLYADIDTHVKAYPEAMSFDVPSDFKIMRVGSTATAITPTGLGPENSMSLAAHTAAALRAKEKRAGAK